VGAATLRTATTPVHGLWPLPLDDDVKPQPTVEVVIVIVGEPLS
jgi:hypothetical protein